MGEGCACERLNGRGAETRGFEPNVPEKERLCAGSEERPKRALRHACVARENEPGSSARESLFRKLRNGGQTQGVREEKKGTEKRRGEGGAMRSEQQHTGVGYF